MSNYSESIFKILGITPNEEFKLTGQNDLLYRITEFFDIEFRNKGYSTWQKSSIPLKVIFLEKYVDGVECRIIKIPYISHSEQIAIDYAKQCGYKWIVKYPYGSVIAFEYEPVKTEKTWLKSIPDSRTMEIETPIDFLSWKDEKPYYIGD